MKLRPIKIVDVHVVDFELELFVHLLDHSKHPLLVFGIKVSQLLLDLPSKNASVCRNEELNAYEQHDYNVPPEYHPVCM